jgi:type IV pilus assembly protein PilZ
LTDSTAFGDVARRGRATLKPALEQLQHVTPAGPFAQRALEHLARAMSALYAGETEATHPAPAGESLRAALGELSHALEALHEAPQGDSTFGHLTEVVARTMSILFPVVQPLSRKRRPVVLPESVPSIDRRALVALGDQLSESERLGAAGRKEQRRDERVVLEVDVGLLSDSNFYVGLAEDVSSGGVFVGTPTPLPAGTDVTLFFVLGSGPTLKAEGRVCWLRSPETGETPGMGVAFTRLGDEERAAIEAFCSERPALFHE